MPTLVEFLEDEITTRLGKLKHDDVKTDVVESVINPSGAAASTARTAAIDEANDFVTKVATELPKHGLYAWIQPELAALASGSIYLASVQCWFAAGPPAATSGQPQLPPLVEEFVRWQAAAFSAAVGADRT